LFKTEEWRSFYSRLFHASGVAEFSMSVRVAGGDRPTVVILVANIPSEKPTVWPRRNIAGRQKAGRPIGKLKEGEECTFIKKPWLMHLLYLCPGMIGFLNLTRFSPLIVIFAVEKVWLWPISPDGAMGDGIQ
jgi:hypothetical protein